MILLPTVWELGAFKIKPKSFWKIHENRKKFFDLLYVKLGCKCMDDWYNVTQQDIQTNGGTKLLNSYYSNSPSSALMSVYPEHNWMEWRFNLSRGYWDKFIKDSKEVSKLVEWLSDKFSIRDLNGWYRVPLESINTWVSGIKSATTLVQLLRVVYPQHQWDVNLFHKRDRFTSQQRVLIALHSLFPQHGTKIYYF